MLNFPLGSTIAVKLAGQSFQHKLFQEVFALNADKNKCQNSVALMVQFIVSSDNHSPTSSISQLTF